MGDGEIRLPVFLTMKLVLMDDLKPDVPPLVIESDSFVIGFKDSGGYQIYSNIKGDALIGVIEKLKINTLLSQAAKALPGVNLDVPT